MNFKLLTFIFVVIGVQSINSSIINKQSIDELVLTSNLDGEIMNFNGMDNPWAKIKYLTFNASETVLAAGWQKELECLDRFNEVKNDFCTRGNGKYLPKFVECFNLNYPTSSLWNCKFFNVKVLNKNVQFKSRFRIYASPGVDQGNAKGSARMNYMFEDTESYDEADDVENNKNKV